MSVTIVTCYYKFKSKHSYEDYQKWIKNFLNKVNANIIIFTDKETKSLLEIKKDNIFFIEKEFNNLEILKTYNNDFWEKQYKLDNPSRHANRTKECYIIWNSKFNFLKEAIDLNPFHSDKFIWNDIGCLRDNRDVKNYPQYEKISNNKLDIILINKLHQKFLNKELYFRDNVFFSGAIFGGTKETILKMHKIFYQIFEKYVKKNHFIGCDQQIITSMYLLNHKLFNPIYNKDWFYLYNYYSNQ